MRWAVEKHLHPLFPARWIAAKRVRKARSHKSAPRVSNNNDTPRRLFVDVSVISKHDAGTGIQRFVRAVASQLLENTPSGWEIQLVSACRKKPYHPISWDSPEETPLNEPVIMQPGDIFLGLDFALDTVRFHNRQLADFKKHGAQLWFVMYDLLPQQRPDWFVDKLVVRYRKWLAILAAQADGFFCISPPVETELKHELEKLYGLANGYKTEVLPMGWDLSASRPSKGLPETFDQLLQKLSPHQTALIVGTLEPRKGHIDVLRAYESLWKNGSRASLVIVGKPGWATQKLQKQLREHPENGKHLFWLENASDEALTKLYSTCQGVIVASHAEGFGLPLIEALGHQKPVLARDIPVFRLHEKHHVRYFPQETIPEDLGEMIEDWLKTPHEHSNTQAIVPTWADTTEAILNRLTKEMI